MEQGDFHSCPLPDKLISVTSQHPMSLIAPQQIASLGGELDRLRDSVSNKDILVELGDANATFVCSFCT